MGLLRNFAGLGTVTAAALGMLAGGAISGSQAAWAGVFDLPHFVAPGEFALGIEPEVTLTSGAGVAANLKYTQGLNDLMNGQVTLGTGSGPRQFRIGAASTFDFFPDIQGQPGIGLALQGLYMRLPDSGQFELTGIPYLHKSFQTAGGEVEPFFALPLGMSFNNGHYQALSQAAIGSMFKSTESFRYIAEFGIAINHTESYFSGGIAYYH